MADMDLEVWKGDWDLPSVDTNCLTVLAYCKFSGVSIDIKATNNPRKSPTGCLPVLRHNGSAYTKVTDIFSYLRRKNWGIDFELNSKQSADILAFTSLLETKLLPAILHLWWGNSQVFIDITRPWYGSAVGFPQSLYVPNRMHKAATDRVETECYPHLEMTPQEKENLIYKEAQECITLLSKRLGNKPFFFGKTPSSLDAIVFGYLAPMLKAPLPVNPLSKHLGTCYNLCQLCSRILSKYFPLSREELEEKRKREEAEKARAQELGDFPHRTRNIVLAVLFALSSMVAFTFFTGMLALEIVDADGGGDNMSEPKGQGKRKS
ncbi:metaxin-1 isoform X2 [Lingula anatina]|uniref:Metaxin-1 isoform X2 n=1 Tax=Lingula anatina TaxID=7574 RepID=A0A1S3HHX9_LINAN|nr:metaxin-1 isoform X2 [Lingula anatina]|eukprot:XP_013385715.1 metaxin-1 isoform X2 [Lingula anatina]